MLVVDAAEVFCVFFPSVLALCSICYYLLIDVFHYIYLRLFFHHTDLLENTPVYFFFQRMSLAFLTASCDLHCATFKTFFLYRS